jgi:hypothetical protein
MGLGNTEQYREFTQRCAREKDWEFQELEGDLRLVRELLSGNWNTEDFAVVPPGSTIVETNTSSILEARDNKSHEV